MKNIIFFVVLFSFCSNILSAQHSISVTGGWTFSTLYKVGTKGALEANSYYADLYDFSLFHAGNINVKYEYEHNAFRLSTGLSLLSIGANDYFFKGADIAYMYLTVPVLFGYKANFSKNFSFIIEGGTELGLNVGNVGSVEVLGRNE